MEHKKSIFQFEDSKGVEWRVEYYYILMNWNSGMSNRQAARIYENGDLYHDFGDQLPYTKTENPTKTQAKEIIAAAKKLNKYRDKRDKQINKILDGTK